MRHVPLANWEPRRQRGEAVRLFLLQVRSRTATREPLREKARDFPDFRQWRPGIAFLLAQRHRRAIGAHNQRDARKNVLGYSRSQGSWMVRRRTAAQQEFRRPPARLTSERKSSLIVKPIPRVLTLWAIALGGCSSAKRPSISARERGVAADWPKLELGRRANSGAMTIRFRDFIVVRFLDTKRGIRVPFCPYQSALGARSQ